jgi:hypothetical protein
MPAIPAPSDPTLEAVDRAIEAGQETRLSNRLGASQIGNPCERALWYGFRWTTAPRFDAATLKRFQDGHDGEAQMAARLRAISCIEIHTHDPETGNQFELTAIEGHFVCYIDGVVLGLLQAPKTWHVWEHKVSEKYAAFVRLVGNYGGKAALREWNEVYYAQAVIGMHLTELTRHYLTVSSPGGRNTMSCRTEANPEEALRLLAKARRVIEAPNAPTRISNDPAFFRCRFCDHAEACHGDKRPLVSCRSCLHSSPTEGGNWHCARFGKTLTIDEQKEGCPAHLYIPSMINGEQIDAAEDGAWVLYRLRDGSEWCDGVAA